MKRNAVEALLRLRNLASDQVARDLARKLYQEGLAEAEQRAALNSMRSEAIAAAETGADSLIAWQPLGQAHAARAKEAVALSQASVADAMAAVVHAHAEAEIIRRAHSAQRDLLRRDRERHMQAELDGLHPLFHNRR
jgi:hypothetical protein